MRQAVLLFSDGPQGVSLVGHRVAGLNLLDRQIRTLARAGMEHVSVLLPKEATPNLTPITQKLPVQVEFVTRGNHPTLPDPEAPYLLLIGEYVHHHQRGYPICAQRLRSWLYPLHIRSKRASCTGQIHSLTKPKIAQISYLAGRFAVIHQCSHLRT